MEYFIMMYIAAAVTIFFLSMREFTQFDNFTRISVSLILSLVWPITVVLALMGE